MTTVFATTRAPPVATVFVVSLILLPHSCVKLHFTTYHTFMFIKCQVIVSICVYASLFFTFKIWKKNWKHLGTTWNQRRLSWHQSGLPFAWPSWYELSHANSCGLRHHEQHVSNKCGRWVKPLEDHAKGESPGLLAFFFQIIFNVSFLEEWESKNHQTQEKSLDFSEDLAKVKKHDFASYSAFSTRILSSSWPFDKMWRGSLALLIGALKLGPDLIWLCCRPAAKIHSSSAFSRQVQFLRSGPVSIYFDSTLRLPLVELELVLNFWPLSLSNIVEQYSTVAIRHTSLRSTPFSLLCPDYPVPAEAKLFQNICLRQHRQHRPSRIEHSLHPATNQKCVVDHLKMNFQEKLKH